ncbi:MAG: hypothetical protein ACP5D7_02515 [Limnospira sp.]
MSQSNQKLLALAMPIAFVWYNTISRSLQQISPAVLQFSKIGCFIRSEPR